MSSMFCIDIQGEWNKRQSIVPHLDLFFRRCLLGSTMVNHQKSIIWENIFSVDLQGELGLRDGCMWCPCSEEKLRNIAFKTKQVTQTPVPKNPAHMAQVNCHKQTYSNGNLYHVPNGVPGLGVCFMKMTARPLIRRCAENVLHHLLCICCKYAPQLMSLGEWQV